MQRITPSLAAALALAAALSLPASRLEAETLRGSHDSMVRQNRVAQEEDFTFLRTPGQVERFVEKGYLVEARGNGDYDLANVSYPYTRPALLTFVERLAAQYHAGCGEKLVVTSLTRPLSLQPRNAHDLSVHPAGMAVDLRVSPRAACRAWLEETLLSLERDGMLDVTREHRPPHYHVAVFPEPYMARVGRTLSDSLRQAEEEARLAASRAAAAPALPAATALRAAAAPPAPGRSGPATIWLPLAIVLVSGAALVDRVRKVRAEDEPGA